MIGESVSIRNQGTGPPWLLGTITSMVSLQQCFVLLNDGRSVERHIDHVRQRGGEDSTPGALRTGSSQNQPNFSDSLHTNISVME